TGRQPQTARSSPVRPQALGAACASRPDVGIVEVLMRITGILGVMVLVSAAVYAQGNGIGGVLIRDIPIPNDKEEWPKILPAGGLVAFGYKTDWSASHREDGKVRVHFLIREEDGGRDSGYENIPEDAVQVFNWACSEPIESPFAKRHPVICSPFVDKS